MESSKMDALKLRKTTFLAHFLVMVCAFPFSSEYTYEEDVYAINSLYTALEYPTLSGWTPFGGDPCFEGWQGVLCVGANITAIVIKNANLGGELGDMLGNFTSIITLDLSNNHIGGSIPENLPLTLRQFFLSSNQLNGRIPSTLADLILLSDISLNENLLNGALPDFLQPLTGLLNMDVSSNNLSGPLPPSMASLFSLTTLHVQNNHFSGFLDVLQDLPLTDLNIENNQFSGPVPDKLWNIANFKSNGNPFNTTVVPSPSPAQALPSLYAPVPSPSLESSPLHGERRSTMSTIAYVAIAAIVILAILLAVYCATKLRENQLKCACIRQFKKKMVPEIAKELLRSTNIEKLKEHEVQISETSEGLRPIMIEKLTAKSIAPLNREINDLSFEKTRAHKLNLTPLASLRSFSFASIQQYTDDFGEEHLIRTTCLGTSYIAKLSDGKLLTVLKLNNSHPCINEDEFKELVLHISELRHQNIVKLVGYCSEVGHWMLIFKYFSKGTLHDSLYGIFKKRLSWIARIQTAIAAARAVEYLHEVCKPAVILRNIEPCNFLIDDELSVCISESGISSFVLSDSLTKFSGDWRAPYGYEAPEVSKSGTFTSHSDVYNFGVVMLELLTGRRPYDSLKSRAEQHLVRWASPQLYDINALSRIVDPSIDGVVSLKSLSRFADIINCCIQQAPEFRPSMAQIVQDLTLVLKDAEI